MQTDMRLQYQDILDESHHGRPALIQTIRTGHQGHPRLVIDPDFLQWAYGHRSVSGIGRFLNVNRDTVRNALLDYGIAEPQQSNFQTSIEVDSMPDGDDTITPEDELLDPHLPIPANLPPDIVAAATPPIHIPLDSTTSGLSVLAYTGPLSMLTDDELDDLILRLRSHFRRAGLSMLDGMLRRLGYRVPRNRISASLTRIDPVQRVFQCIRIRRQTYSVPGPMYLWHHDGQHGKF